MFGRKKNDRNFIFRSKIFSTKNFPTKNVRSYFFDFDFFFDQTFFDQNVFGHFFLGEKLSIQFFLNIYVDPKFSKDSKYHTHQAKDEKIDFPNSESLFVYDFSWFFMVFH